MESVLFFGELEIDATDLGEESSVPDLLGGLILQNNLEFYLEEEDEIYEGYGRYPNAYPYRQNNGYTGQLKRQCLKTAVLENRYLRAEFLTELGGRLWSLVDKTTGRNLLYTNDVIQFRNLAVRNAWFSGGVEWNMGIIGHTPFTTAPLYVAKLEDEKGNPVLRMYEYERIRKASYQIDFWLEEDSRFLNCRMRIVNPEKEVVPMYWWSNMAVPEYDGGRIIVPAEQAYTNRAGGVYKVNLPMVEGIDVTRYQNIPKSVDYFFKLDKELPTYIAHVDEGGYGLLHLSTSRLQSRKLFSWGNNSASDRWQEFLTRNGGKYLEIQAGLGKTQYGCIPMAPHTAWEWIEQYGAVQLTEKEQELPNRELSRKLSERILRETGYMRLEEQLKETKKMAKTPASLVATGSVYGAWAKERRGIEHLEFSAGSGQMGEFGWQKFLQTGYLQEREVNDRPDTFVLGETYLKQLRETIQTVNKDNWYAHYHLGLLEYQEARYKHAEEAFQNSLKLKENPWAYHGLACLYLVTGRKENVSAVICKGMKMREQDCSYQKEGFRLLSLCKDSTLVVDFYEKLPEHQKQESRIRFYYIQAMYRLGQIETAFAMLNEKGGLVLEDLREGEESVGQLWSAMHKELIGEEAPVPYQFNFMAF